MTQNKYTYKKKYRAETLNLTNLAQLETRSAMRAPVETVHLTRNSKALSGLYLPETFYILTFVATFI